MTTEQPNAGPITLDDVRNAIGETDPNSTNAGKLHKILGRGSMATIQKHLMQVRIEQAPVLPGTQAPAPAAPRDALDALWAVAWSAAQAMTHGRAETLSAQRDAALTLSETQALDITALAGQVDALTEQMTAAQNDAAALAAKAEADLVSAAQAAAETAELLAWVTEEKAKVQADALQAAELAKAEAAKVIEQLKAEKARVEADAAHAAQLATRDAQITAQAMQSTIDRLNDQVGELKSLLIVRTQAPAPAAPAAAPTPSPAKPQ